MTGPTTGQRKLRLGAFFSGTGSNMASWRNPQAVPRRPHQPAILPGLDPESGRGQAGFRSSLATAFTSARSRTPFFLNRFEPLTLLAALAMDTSHIGVAANLSTTYSETLHRRAPVHVHRPHQRGGGPGWNIVNLAPWKVRPLNYSKPEHPAHDLRYEMAHEFLEVTKGLWDSWGGTMPSSLTRRPAPFSTRPRCTASTMPGRFYSVQGPLNISRSRQGRPGADSGRLVGGRPQFCRPPRRRNLHRTAQPGSGPGISTNDVKGRAAEFGRKPDGLLILPGCAPIVGTHRGKRRTGSTGRL